MVGKTISSTSLPESVTLYTVIVRLPEVTDGIHTEIIKESARRLLSLVVDPGPVVTSRITCSALPGLIAIYHLVRLGLFIFGFNR